MNKYVKTKHRLKQRTCADCFLKHTFSIKYDLTILNYEQLANSSILYPPTKGYFRETCKSQNINPISPTLKFILGISQIITKPFQLC